MKIQIRQENNGDHAMTHELNTLVFGQEDEAKLVDRLRVSKGFVPELSLVATHNDKVVGHILFTKIRIVDSDHHEIESLALAPMAVRPEYQNKGIGGRMIMAGLKKAKELHFNSVIVLGHEHYYPKFGFLPADKWNIKAPFEVPANVFMGIELTENGLKNVSGIVMYPKEFNGF